MLDRPAPPPRAALLLGVACSLAVLLGRSPSSRSAAGADVVVYNGRSQYGDEAAFTAFEEATGKSLELRGGTAPELFERLRSEGDETPADLLVTTDLANLWRAKEAGLLAAGRRRRRSSARCRRSTATPTATGGA